MMTNPASENNSTTTTSSSPFVIKVKKSDDKWHIKTGIENPDLHKKDVDTSLVKLEPPDMSMLLNQEKENIDTGAAPTTDTASSEPEEKRRRTCEETFHMENDGLQTSKNIKNPTNKDIFHQEVPGIINRRQYACNLCSFHSMYLQGFLNHVMKCHYVLKSSQVALHEPFPLRSDLTEECLAEEQGDLSTKTLNSPGENLRNSVMLPSAINASADSNNEKSRKNICAEITSAKNEIPDAEMPVVLEYYSNHVDAIKKTVASVSQDAMETDVEKPFVELTGQTKNESSSTTISDDHMTQPASSKHDASMTSNPSEESLNLETSSHDKSSSSHSSSCSSNSPTTVSNAKKASRGAKLNSIVNNLYGPIITTTVTTTPSRTDVPESPSSVCSNCGIQTNSKSGAERCYQCSQKYPQLIAKSRNVNRGKIFQQFNNGNRHISYNHSVPHSYTRDKAIFPPNDQTRAKDMALNLGRGIGFPQNNHFEDLQSLMQSGAVTMPDRTVLQSINCTQEKWNYIQELLHEAFSTFPYLTKQECQALARLTGLIPKQISTLFVVARLQHGISWEQHEIDSARRQLFNISQQRFQFPRNRKPENKNTGVQSPPPVLKQTFHYLTKEQHNILKWSFTSIPLTIDELNRLENVTKLEKSTILHYFKQLNSHMSPTQPEVESLPNANLHPSHDSSITGNGVKGYGSNTNDHLSHSQQILNFGKS